MFKVKVILSWLHWEFRVQGQDELHNVLSERERERTGKGQ